MADAQQPKATLTAVALPPSHSHAPQVLKGSGATPRAHATWSYRFSISPSTSIWVVIREAGSADQAPEALLTTHRGLMTLGACKEVHRLNMLSHHTAWRGFKKRGSCAGTHSWPDRVHPRIKPYTWPRTWRSYDLSAVKAEGDLKFPY